MIDWIDDLGRFDPVKEIIQIYHRTIIVMQRHRIGEWLNRMKFSALHKSKRNQIMRYIGVDLHTNSLTACYFDGDDYQFKTFETNKAGLSEFRLTLKKQDKLAVESTGNSNYCYQQVIKSVDEIIVVNPSQFNVIRNSVKKTDKNDARALAFYLSKEMLPESRVKSEAHIQVARISHSREQLVKTRTSLINKLHGIFNSLGYKLKKEILTTQKGLNGLLQYDLDELTKMEVNIFKQQIEQLTQGIKQMDVLLQGAGEKLSGFEKINSIKGIGEKSASILLSCIGDIKDFESADKLAAYFGIVPRVSNSNETERSGRITKLGTKLGRTTLVQCTLIAIRYSDFLRSFYEKIKAKKGSGKAIIATARKLLKTIYLTLKNNWVFEDFPNYVLRKN